MDGWMDGWGEVVYQGKARREEGSFAR